MIHLSSFCNLQAGDDHIPSPFNSDMRRKSASILIGSGTVTKMLDCSFSKDNNWTVSNIYIFYQDLEHFVGQFATIWILCPVTQAAQYNNVCRPFRIHNSSRCVWPLGRNTRSRLNAQTSHLAYDLRSLGGRSCKSSSRDSL